MKKFLRQRGQATVEFTLLLPIFALILFATIYVGFFVVDYVTLDNAAAQAARHAALNKTGNYDITAIDQTKIEKTKLFLSWYELRENNCTKISQGNINETTGEFEVAPDGGYVRVMIQANLKDSKKDTILKEIMPNAYTVSKVAEIQQGGGD